MNPLPRSTPEDILRTRAEIAALCGLSDSARIRSAGVRRRIVDTSMLDTAYLVEMGMLYRADVVESRGRLGIAKALLAEADAKKIPWATFIDAGFARERSDGRSGEQDEWSIQLGIEIPLFEWTKINKRSAAYRKAATAWEMQMEKQRHRVKTEIDLAINRLRGTAAAVRAYESTIARERDSMVQRLKKLEANTTDLNDYSRVKRAKYDTEDIAQQMEIGRYEAWSDYNKALQYLEDAVGVRIEKVLSGARSK